jgi:hypothetical protein
MTMIGRILRQVTGSGMATGRRGAPPSRFGRSASTRGRGTSGGGGTGAMIGAAVERYMRQRGTGRRR